MGDLELIGWREYVSLPDLGLVDVNCKVDSGARTSSLHAVDLEVVREGEVDHVRFTVWPHQRSQEDATRCQARLLEYRDVRSSNGQTERRPIIETSLRLFDSTWKVELSLTNRAQMGFRMLLGRGAIRNRFVIDVGRSYCAKRRPDHSDEGETTS